MGVFLLCEDNTALQVEKAAAIYTDSNNYAAEAAAALLAIMMTPSNHHLTIYTDSLSLVQALQDGDSEAKSENLQALSHRSTRQWLRAGSRALLRTIWLLSRQRTAPTAFEWVRAHTGQDDFKSMGNDKADQLANRGRTQASGCDLEPLCTNDERVLAYLTADNKKTLCQGDLRILLKRQRQHIVLQQWLSLSCADPILCANPSGVIELCARVRRRARTAELNFLLETLPGMGDTAARRRTLIGARLSPSPDIPWLRAWSANDVCFFCQENETKLHFLECPKLMRRLHKEVRSAQKAADPEGVLPPSVLEWCFHDVLPLPTPPPGGQLSVRSSTWPNDCETFARHSRLASACGVAPPNAMNFYLSYWQSLRQDLPMQELREQATATIRAINNALFKVGFGAWSIWRRRKISHVTQRQRALRRAAKAAAAVAEEQRWNTELSHFRNRTAMLLRISRCKRLKQMRRASRMPRF